MSDHHCTACDMNTPAGDPTCNYCGDSILRQMLEEATAYRDFVDAEWEEHGWDREDHDMYASEYAKADIRVRDLEEQIRLHESGAW